MPLVAPTYVELQAFVHPDLQSMISDETYSEAVIQQSTDLFQLATGRTITPTDAFELRIYKNGILSMTEYLIATAPNRSAEYGPFQAERMGSYQYQKVAAAAAAGEPTSIMWFDTAVEYFLNILTGDENVLIESALPCPIEVPSCADPGLVQTYWGISYDTFGR